MATKSLAGMDAEKKDPPFWVTSRTLKAVFVKAVVAWFRFRLRVWLARPWFRRRQLLG